MSKIKLETINQSQSTLLLKLSGNWTLFAGIPETDELQKKIQSDAIKLISFNTTEVKEWDSGFLTWLITLIDYCQEHALNIDKTGLPAGVCRLLALANAVPERKGARRDIVEPPFLAKIGEELIASARITGEFIAFFGESLLVFFKLITGKAVFSRSELWFTIQNAGVGALPIVSLVSFLVGMILAFVGAVQLQNFGAGIYIADLVGIAMMREMAAVMTGIIMAGRTGAAYAAEIGTMTVNEEVDALETAGFSAMEFLVLPRILALVLMMPLLAIYADLMGILGGSVVAISILDLTFTEYTNQLISAVSLGDFFAGIFMATVFGAIIAIVGCLRGIKCGRSSQAVGLATTSAVVSSMVMIVVASAVLTVLYNALGI